MTPDERMDRHIDRMLRDLPLEDPPDRLWPSIEHRLRLEQTDAARSDAGARRRLFAGRRQVLAAALYSLLILTGVGMSYVLLMPERTPELTRRPTGSDREMLASAQADIAEAIRYYDRAVSTLGALAARNESNLDPRYVAAQKEKIALLRASIEECKTALRTSGPHPEVQHYLLAAYNDLQATLQSMVSPSDS